MGQVNFIDFGFAKTFRDANTYLHIPFAKNRSFVGSNRFGSINTHAGIEQTRRDDMESLAYIFIYFLSGSLPWQCEEKRLATGSRKVWKKKTSISPVLLCGSLPEEFCTFLDYARALEFDQKPDYEYLRKIFRDLSVREGYQYDSSFDWNVVSEAKENCEEVNPCRAVGRRGTIRKAKEPESSDRRYNF
jgi:casein kinase I family protein HRR25